MIEWLDKAVQRFFNVLSHLLDPIAYGVDMLNDWVRHQLEIYHVPFEWRTAAVSVTWALVLFMLLRTLTGWIRMVVVLFLVIVLAKLYGYIPVE